MDSKPIQGSSSAGGDDLRQRAEARLAALAGEELAALMPGQIPDLVHELRVHQIELEMQNQELRRAEEALEAARARYFDLYDLAPVGYLTLDEQGLIQETNLTAAQLLGITRDQLVRRPFARFVFPADQDAYYLFRRRLLAAATGQTCELRLMRPNRAPFWARLDATVTRAAVGEGERPRSLCRVTLTDITDRKQAEEEVRRALSKERELNDLKSRFIERVSHEFRTPLTIILSSIEILIHYGHKLSDEKKRVHAQNIQNAIQRMIELLDASLMLRKAMANELEFTPVTADLTHVCQDAIALARSETDERHRLEFVLSSDELARPIEGVDPYQIRLILKQLLANAIKFSPHGGLVRLELDRETDQVILRVSDYGIGIPDEDQPYIGEPFFRARNAENFPGVGLGLVTVKKLVDLSGGTLTFTSRVDVGTTFEVRLPIQPTTR